MEKGLLGTRSKLRPALKEVKPTAGFYYCSTSTSAMFGKANLSINDIDLFEINEAFAAVALASVKS